MLPLTLLSKALVPTNRETEQPASSSSPSLSPDKLLANRLCGQCHTYFDFSRWRPYDEKHDASVDMPVIAHMEEVVFDVSDASLNLFHQIEVVYHRSFNILAHIAGEFFKTYLEKS